MRHTPSWVQGSPLLDSPPKSQFYLIFFCCCCTQPECNSTILLSSQLYPLLSAVPLCCFSCALTKNHKHACLTGDQVIFHHHFSTNNRASWCTVPSPHKYCPLLSSPLLSNTLTVYLVSPFLASIAALSNYPDKVVVNLPY